MLHQIVRLCESRRCLKSLQPQHGHTKKTPCVRQVPEKNLEWKQAVVSDHSWKQTYHNPPGPPLPQIHAQLNDLDFCGWETGH